MTGSNVEFAPTLDGAEQMLLDDLQEGDLLITMGAGDVWKVGDAVLSALREKEASLGPNQTTYPARYAGQALDLDVHA